MERILIIARNGFRGILHARSLYLWIIAVLVVGVQLAPQIIFRDNLPDFTAFAGQRPLPEGMPEEQKKQIRENFEKQREIQRQQIRERFRKGRPGALASGLGTWSMLAMLFAALLGANILASEVSAKTVITVLARPISRWELLFGKWLAIQVFGVLSLAVGVGIHLAAGWYLSVSFSSFLLIALLDAMTCIMLYSALGLILGTFMGPLIAAAITAFAYFLPTFVAFLKASETRWVHWIGVVMNIVIPPGFKSVFVNSVDATLAFDRSAFSKNLLENLLYCSIFFVLACVMFSRREVRLG